MFRIPRSSHRFDVISLVGALVAMQWALWMNPGYFSHDELQWAARADVARLADLPFESWLAVDTFQFRPLTFNLWLLLSYALFSMPALFHMVFVLLGAGNAVLLDRVLRAAGCPARTAFITALVFGLCPYAVWVQGWVGCLADLLWVGCALGIVRVLQLRPALGVAVAVAAVGTTLALLAKEAALSIPALLLWGAWLLRREPGARLWWAAALASAAVALLYLALRFDTLTRPGEAVSTYGLQWLAWPARWAEYLLFPWALKVPEIHVLQLFSPRRWALLALAPLALGWVLWRASGRLLLVWLVGGALALGPVLVLPVSSNQYGYGFAAFTCGVVALAWGRLQQRRERIVLKLLVIVALAHGFQIQWQLHFTGRIQSVFSPSLAAQAQAQPEGPIRLWPERPQHYHIYARLSHEVPSWQGVPLGPRVHMAGSAAEATHVITSGGRVQPVAQN